MSRIRRIAPGLGRGGLIGNTEGPESYLRELDTLPSQFARATGGTETVISQGGKFYRVHTFTDTDPTSLLLNFDGSNGSTTFTDDSGWGHAVTANGNAQISTTQSKFGGSSLYLDGTGDYLTVPDSSLWNIANNDFTLEFWWRPETSAASKPFVGQFQDVLNYWYAGTNASGHLVLQGFSGGSKKFEYSGSHSFSLNTWAHVAFVRSSSSCLMFVDGASLSVSQAQAFSTIADIADTLRIGELNGTVLPGYIDGLRITKGQALYTAAFTPPTTALSRVGSGSLTFTRGGAVEYLVVGGGGGGGGGTGGGGGAGGYRCSVVGESSGGGASAEPKFFAPAKTVGVSVGAGGAGGDNAAGESGCSSLLDSIESVGGGGGGFASTAVSDSSGGGNGGSGGGGSAFNIYLTNGGSGTSIQGYDGGDSVSPGASFNAGGGGGAGSVGQTSPSASEGGDGGDGIESLITGSLTGIAGGGGGRGDASSGAATDGGGAGGSTGSSATANTGGGGGGSAGLNDGGDGGSGIVIARYRITQAEYEAEAA